MKNTNMTKAQLADEIARLKKHVRKLEAEKKNLLKTSQKSTDDTKLYREIADSISDVFFAMDKDLRYIYWNKASKKLTGISAKDAIGKTIYELFPNSPETKKIAKIYRQVIKTKKPKKFINKHKLNGQNYIFEINAHPLNNGVSVFVKDITKEKRAQEVLMESEESYKTLIENSLTGIFINQAGKYVFVNNKLAEMHGYEPEELLGKDYLTLIHPDERDTIREVVLKRLEGESIPQRYEVRRIRKDGKTVWCEMMAVRIQHKGRPAIMGNIIDITERKRLEEILKKEQQELKLIIDSSPIIVFYKDKAGKFMRVNKAFAEALKMPEEEFVGKTVFDLYSEKIAQGMTDDDHEVLKSGRPKLNIIEQYESASGIRWVQTDKIPICDNNGILVGLIGFAQDITERKKAEEMLSAKMSELERINRLFVGRENRMVELKEEVNVLLEKLGQPKKYSAPDTIDKELGNRESGGQGN